MLRRLATLLLLLPLSLNGLWMLCADGRSAAEPLEASTQTTEAAPKCTKTICPLHKPQTGAICIISSNGDGSSIAAIMFAVAVPPAVETLSASTVVLDVVPEQATYYSNPILSGLTPPPKA